MHELIIKYFPEVNKQQKEQFDHLYDLYLYWNSRINVISRKDIESLYLRHVLHSLTIAKFIKFNKSTEILDVGTGGGFPGVPLAIMYPESDFYLVDSIGKKIKVVNNVVKALKLSNVKAAQIRAEELKHEFDFVVCRAVASLPDFMRWVKGLVKKNHSNNIKNGIIYLKGGNLEDELKSYKHIATLIPVSDYFSEEFFLTKKLVYIPFY